MWKQVVWSCRHRRWRCPVLHRASRQAQSELQVLQPSRTLAMSYRHGRTRSILEGRRAAADCHTSTATGPFRQSRGRQLEAAPRRTCHRRRRHDAPTGRRGILRLAAKIASWDLAVTNWPAPCDVSLIVMRASCDYVSSFMTSMHVHVNGYIIASVRLTHHIHAATVEF